MAAIVVAIVVAATASVPIAPAVVVDVSCTAHSRTGAIAGPPPPCPLLLAPTAASSTNAPWSTIPASWGVLLGPPFHSYELSTDANFPTGYVYS